MNQQPRHGTPKGNEVPWSPSQPNQLQEDLGMRVMASRGDSHSMVKNSTSTGSNIRPLPTSDTRILDQGPEQLTRTSSHSPTIFMDRSVMKVGHCHHLDVSHPVVSNDHNKNGPEHHDGDDEWLNVTSAGTRNKSRLSRNHSREGNELVELLSDLQVQNQQAMVAVVDQVNQPNLSHIPKFDGQTSFKDHVSTLKANFKVKNVPEHRWVRYLFESIDSDLHLWLIRADDQDTLMDTDFLAAVNYLQSKFPDKMTTRRKRNIFRELNQGEEGAIEYLSIKERKARVLDIPMDDSFWDEVVNGLKNEMVRNAMRRYIEDEHFDPKFFESKLRRTENKYKGPEQSSTPTMPQGASEEVPDQF